MESYDERIATVEHWLEQDHRVFTNLLETIKLARLDEIDYDEIGWYIGDSLGRLMLRPADFDMWLDPDFHQTDAFQGLMKSHIAAPLVCEPVRSANDLDPVGEAEILAAD